MTDVVVFGAGKLAELLSLYISNDENLRIVGFTVDSVYLPSGGRLGSLPVVPWETLEQDFPPDEVMILGPVSYRDNNRFRWNRYLEGKRRGYSFATYIHPSSHVVGAEIGENSIILEECTVQPFARLGPCSVLWSKVHIGHHAEIGDACFFASFSGIAGNSRVGSRSFFGGQTGLVDNCSVGADCIVAAGTVVTRPMPDGAVARGGKVRILENAANRFGKTLLG